MNFSKKTKKINLISACFGKGQDKQGVELGPSALLSKGLINQIQALGWEVNQNIELLLNEHLCHESDKLECPDSVYKAYIELREILKEIPREELILTLGGDHSIALGTLSAHKVRNPNFCLLWIDAHADINTIDTTNSGHFHGMPLSFLIKEVGEEFPFKAGKYPFLKDINPVLTKENIAYIGLRDVEEKEKEILKKLGITAFFIDQIDRFGIYEVIKAALEKINPQKSKSIHVSFDLDSLDPLLMPSTGCSIPGGLSLREALSIGEEIAKMGSLGMLDLVELNPLIGKKRQVDRSISHAIEIILSFLGKKRGL